MKKIILVLLFVLIMGCSLLPNKKDDKIINKFISEKKYEEAGKIYQKKRDSAGIRKIADLFKADFDYSNAKKYYEILEISEKNIYKIFADFSYLHKKYEESFNYYQKINDNIGMKKIGNAYMDNGEYEKGIKIMVLSGTSEGESYRIAGEKSFEKNELYVSGEFFLKAKNKISIKKVADQLFYNGDYEGGIKFYAKADFSKKEAYIKAGDMSYDNGEYEVSSKYYEKAKDNLGLMKVASLYVVLEEFDQAIDKFKLAGLTSEVANNKIGDYLFKKGNYENASKYYEKSNDLSRLKRISEIYLAKNDYEMALDYYIKGGISEQEAYNKIAEQSYKKGELNLAVGYYMKSNNIAGIKKIAKRFFEDGDIDLGVEYFIKSGEEENDVFLRAGDASFENGEYELAGKYYEKSEKIHNLKKVGGAYFIKENYLEGIKYYLKAGISEKEAFLKVGDLLYKKGDLIESIQYYIKANSTQDINRVLNIFFNENKYDLAAKYLIKSGISEKEAFNKAGEMSFENGFYKESGEFFIKAKNKEFIKKIGDIFYKEKKYDLAKDYYIAGDFKNDLEKIGNDFFGDNNIEKAMSYYILSKSKNKLQNIAKIYLNEKKYDNAISAFISSGMEENKIFELVGNKAFDEKKL